MFCERIMFTCPQLYCVFFVSLSDDCFGFMASNFTVLVQSLCCSQRKKTVEPTEHYLLSPNTGGRKSWTLHCEHRGTFNRALHSLCCPI